LDFRQLVNRLAKGASLTILSDSCHSGGLIDKEKEQIGPSSSVQKGPTSETSDTLTNKNIPYDSILHHLASQTKATTTEMGTHMLELFGSCASLSFQTASRELLEMLGPDEGILLSGCQADETSADMSPGQGGGKAYGAFSNAVEMVLRENEGGLSNREVVVRARKVLQSKGFEQHPCLYCSDENADAPFLWQPQKTEQWSVRCVCVCRLWCVTWFIP